MPNKPASTFMTKASKHTPGPWTGQHKSFVLDDCPEFKIYAFGRGYIATVNSSRDENLANAHLIAAAPELLEALIKVRRVGDDKMAFRSEWVAAVAKADAAIAKATGAA